MKVGSDRKVFSRLRGPWEASVEIGYTTIQILRGGTLRNWRFHEEVYSEKAPRRYAGKAAKLLRGTRIMLEIGCPDALANSAQIVGFPRANIRPWAPKTVPKTVPILPDFETVPKLSRNRPECKPPRWYACKSLLCLKSDAQLLSQIAHRSLVFLRRIFGLGHPKPSGVCEEQEQEQEEQEQDHHHH